MIEATLGSWFPGDSSPETREPSLFFSPLLSLLPLKAFVLKEPHRHESLVSRKSVLQPLLTLFLLVWFLLGQQISSYV